MRTSLAAFLAAFAIGFLFAEPAEARPPAPFSFSLTLNGEPVCDLSADGGCVRLVSATTAVASATVNCGAVYRIDCASTAANVCFKPTDGGCSTSIYDVNYGAPVPAASYLYAVTDDCAPATTKIITAVATNGTGLACSAMRLR